MSEISFRTGPLIDEPKVPKKANLTNPKMKQPKNTDNKQEFK